jgi:iron complex transport system ATP-binding protein
MTLSIENLRVVLRGREVLRDVRLEARRGELLVVVGPNGAGKTTLLKAVACLLAAEGRLAWDGRSLPALSAAERARTIAYLPQGHVAHWPIRARDVVTIGRVPLASSLARLSRADEDAIEEALNAVDAAGFADRPVTELSGGERARIMLARALAVGAPLLLADEPVAALDPAHQLAVMGILSAQASAGRLVIAVSHDLLLAARYATRIVVMLEGRVVAFGTPADTLTAQTFRDVFDVEAVQVSAEGLELEIPWAPAALRR